MGSGAQKHKIRNNIKSLQWRHHETAMTVKTYYLHLTALYKANATSRNAVTFHLAPISEQPFCLKVKGLQVGQNKQFILRHLSTARGTLCQVAQEMAAQWASKLNSFTKCVIPQIYRCLSHSAQFNHCCLAFEQHAIYVFLSFYECT